MTRIITAAVVCLLLGGSCFAQAPATKPTAEVLSDAQLREVQRYRSDERSNEVKRIEYLTRRVAEMKQTGNEEERRRSEEALEDAKKKQKQAVGPHDTTIWRKLEAQKYQEGFEWQEPKPTDNGEQVEGKWVQVLTPAQLQEIRTWVRKEMDLMKEMSQWRIERREAMESGDSGKVRLIDGRLLDMKRRVPIPLGTNTVEQWAAIVKEQARRGLEWHERPTENRLPPATGGWRPKEPKAKKK